MNEAIETPNAAEESTSLADHESSFHAPEPRPEAAAVAVSEPDAPAGDEPVETDAERAERERDDQGRFKPKHRAKSQRATPADVPRIQELTRRLRETEAERDRLKALSSAPAPVKREPPKDFTDPEPQYEDFADQPDQYQAHMRALAAWDRRKEAAEQSKTQYETSTKAEIEARNAARDVWFKEQESKHLDRMKAYHEAHPEAQQILDAAGEVWLTPAMYAAVMTAENSPELLIRVAQDVDLRDDLIDLTEGKPLSRDLVERVQRRLNRGVKAVTTGSAAPQPKPVPAVPRPPNPVRTGPMKTGDALPDDDSSLTAHESAYYGKGRRR